MLRIMWHIMGVPALHVEFKTALQVENDLFRTAKASRFKGFWACEQGNE